MYYNFSVGSPHTTTHNAEGPSNHAAFAYSYYSVCGLPRSDHSPTTQPRPDPGVLIWIVSDHESAECIMEIGEIFGIKIVYLKLNFKTILLKIVATSRLALSRAQQVGDNHLLLQLDTQKSEDEERHTFCFWPTRPLTKNVLPIVSLRNDFPDPCFPCFT